MTTLAEARHPAFNTNGARLKLAEGGASMGKHSLIDTTATTLEKKVGSIQEFVCAECSMDDLSPSKLNVDEVHKIAILDIRLMNADRNAANLLCVRRHDDSLELVPIDHGYCLRSVCEVSWFDWCWLDWPQLRKPLSNRSKEYIRNLDIEADVLILKKRLNIAAEVLDHFRASTKMLKAGVDLGLSLYDIALMCCRYDDQGIVRSKLERITSQAQELAMNAVENDKWLHCTASRAIEEQLSVVVTRAQSMVDFSSLLQPDRTITSSSESCSVDSEEDCEMWAATILADVQNEEEDQSQASESSSTYEGFWYVNPGSVTESLSSSIDDKPILGTSMVRSHSYAALSSKQGSESTPRSLLHRYSTLGSVDEEYEQHHVYVIKFIDLLIERETRLRSSELGI